MINSRKESIIGLYHSRNRIKTFPKPEELTNFCMSSRNNNDDKNNNKNNVFSF